MSEAIKGLQPELLWKYFAEISKIPRPSKHEKAIATYVMNVAKKFGVGFAAIGTFWNGMYFASTIVESYQNAKKHIKK